MLVNVEEVHAFLAQRRIAVVGISRRADHFGATVYRALRDHGYDVVPVGGAESVDGAACVERLADVAGPLDGVIVMVGPGSVMDVVRQAEAAGVTRIWLFRGIGGGEGAATREAVEFCRDRSISVVAGACPLMFLEPVGWVHRAHRRVRRARGQLTAA